MERRRPKPAPAFRQKAAPTAVSNPAAVLARLREGAQMAERGARSATPEAGVLPEGTQRKHPVKARR